jgi:membrane protease YdiL (CAAX protease family)
MRPGAGRILYKAVLGWGFAVPAALAGVIIARKLHLTNLSAAWITFGFFGMAGGAGFVLPIRAAGGRAGAAHALTLAGIWTPCLVAAVIPMFFTMGFPAKMAFMSLLFFSFFGALGGLGSAWIFESSFPATRRIDLVPSAACLGFGFGLAAVSGGIAGSVGAGILPQALAWLLGFGIMAAVAGMAGGCALLLFLGRSDRGGGAFQRKEVGRIQASSVGLAFWTILLLGPFYANDLADIYVQDWRIWLMIDYTAVKLLPLLVLAWLIQTDKITPAQLGVSGVSPLVFAAVLYAALLFGTFIDQNAILLIGRIAGHPRLGGMPEIASPFFRRLDLTIGLMMVAVCEELVFRGYLLAALRRFTRDPLVIVLVSAVAFGLIHWSGGMHRVVATGLIGAIFMMLYIRCRSVHPLIVAHFLINFIDFSGLVPTDMFRYM